MPRPPVTEVRVHRFAFDLSFKYRNPVIVAADGYLGQITGRVTLPDREGPALVELHQLSTGHDVAGLTDVVLDALRIIELDGVREVVRSAYLDADGTPASALGDDPDRVREWATANITGFNHLSSTCREGIVADQFGRVLGYDNLLICDASLFAKAPARNPYIPVIQLAERLTAHWRRNGI